MARRYNRRPIRPIEEMPSLFEPGKRLDEAAFEVSLTDEAQRDARDGATADISDLVLPADTGLRRRPLMFISFGSGSSGNCSYIGTTDCGILIDAGCDNNYVTEQLLRNGIDMSAVQGIILTHDHADHVRYSYALLRRNTHMRLYCTPRTLEGLLRRHNLSRRIKDYHSPVFKEHQYHFGELTVTPFETSHDGTDNAGFFIERGEQTFVVATDMGVVTERADHYLRRACAMMIEANYDSHMLQTGRYPEYLKRRIRSERGHMDNAETAAYLARIYTPALRHVFLCHLSQDNNTPASALDAVRDALTAARVTVTDSTANIAPGALYLATLPRFAASQLYFL